MTLRTRPFALDLVRPLSTAHGPIESREGVLVGVELDGTRGVGEATPLPGWTEPLGACRRALDAADASTSPEALDGTPAARHGLELARTDARARDAGVSLSRWVGDSDPASRVPVNATVGGADAEATVQSATRAVEAGFECLKLKVGVDSLDADVRRVEAVRDAVGDDIALRVDANGAWDRETASKAVKSLAALGVSYVEQPLPASDVAGHATLRGHGVDIAVDETLLEHALDAVIARDAADVVVLKPMVLGGPKRAVTAAETARDAGLDPVVTTTIDAAPARAAATHVAATIDDVRPCGLATGGHFVSDVADVLSVEDGAIRVPEGPGNCGDAFDSLLW